MTDRDTITLPREVAEYLMETMEELSQSNDWYWSERDKVALPALRTALAAPKQEPEPVAWQERHFFPKVGEWTHWYDCRPRMADYPREQIEQNGVRYQWRPLYAAPPDAPTVKESLTHPGYVIGSHWLETAYSRVCAGEAEADVLRDCGWERVDESLRRDAERHRWLRGEHSRIDPCIKANAKYRLERDSSTWVNIHDLDAAIDAAMKGGT